MRERKLGLATREAYGRALIELGAKNPNVVVLDADLSKSTKTELFGQKFPERFFNVGIAEANLVGIASGLAASGKIPFISSFACFLICKGYDQLRMGAAFPKLNVKAVASHGGISVGEDGVSQQAIEDFALTASLPNFVVLNPSDEVSARALVLKMADYDGPVYMRTGRPKAAVIYDASANFEIGRGVRLVEGTDVTILATGLMVFEALLASDELKKKGISASVCDIHTIKPLDRKLVLEEAKKTGAIVICEEHQIYGGLGSIVSKFLAGEAPTPIEFVAINDTYAESGRPDELLEHYRLTSPYIAEAAERVVKRKKK
jgi:transketolase